ncbi:MAG: hypothetical protein AAFV86_21175, partial [Pseudomonadota bacterium]
MTAERMMASTSSPVPGSTGGSTASGSGDGGARLAGSSIAFGRMGASPPGPRPDGRRLRIALLGDFSGGAGRGSLESGRALADRGPIALAIDWLDDVIAGFSMV